MNVPRLWNLIVTYNGMGQLFNMVDSALAVSFIVESPITVSLGRVLPVEVPLDAHVLVARMVARQDFLLNHLTLPHGSTQTHHEYSQQSAGSATIAKRVRI